MAHPRRGQPSTRPRSRRDVAGQTAFFRMDVGDPSALWPQATGRQPSPHVRRNRPAYTPNLALSATMLARCLRSATPKALGAIDEAVSLWRILANDNPAAFDPDLGEGVRESSQLPLEVGDDAGALLASDQAIMLYRSLHKADWDAVALRPCR